MNTRWTKRSTALKIPDFFFDKCCKIEAFQRKLVCTFVTAVVSIPSAPLLLNAF